VTLEKGENSPFFGAPPQALEMIHMALNDDWAEFTLDNSDVEDAQFNLVIDEGRKTEAEEEADVKALLEREGISSAESDFLGNGTILYTISSNVFSIQYLWLNPDGSPLNQLYVAFRDGSLYAYYDVPLEVARQMYHANSYGKAVWQLLRQEGSVYGHKFAYALVSGNRVWYDAGKDSQGRHESLKKKGEPFKGYHPATNWEGAKGRAGSPTAGVNLNKRGGTSRKVQIFTPIQARTSHIPPAGPFS
jgi:hypothetical protein